MIIRRLACLAVLTPSSLSITLPVSPGTASVYQGGLADGTHDPEVACYIALINGRGKTSLTGPSPTGNKLYRLHKP
jgi:hypothetical protein